MSISVAKNKSDSSISCEIDTSGTRCPLPLLRAKQALKTMESGQVLRVLATDPAAKPDFDAMLKHQPHEMVAYRRGESADEKYPWIDVIDIRKGGDT